MSNINPLTIFDISVRQEPESVAKRAFRVTAAVMGSLESTAPGAIGLEYRTPPEIEKLFQQNKWDLLA